MRKGSRGVAAFFLRMRGPVAGVFVFFVAVGYKRQASECALWKPREPRLPEALRQAEQVAQRVVLQDSTCCAWVEPCRREEGLVLALIALLVHLACGHGRFAMRSGFLAHANRPT